MYITTIYPIVYHVKEELRHMSGWTKCKLAPHKVVPPQL